MLVGAVFGLAVLSPLPLPLFEDDEPLLLTPLTGKAGWETGGAGLTFGSGAGGSCGGGGAAGRTGSVGT